jgi:hypothetical protein
VANWRQHQRRQAREIWKRAGQSGTVLDQIMANFAANAAANDHCVFGTAIDVTDVGRFGLQGNAFGHDLERFVGKSVGSTATELAEAMIYG